MQPFAGAQNKVALYARVSTDEQREGNTIESQVTELERFAKQNGWQIHARYLDQGWSGALLARPELDRLRDDAGRGLFGAVLLNDVDRLARDVSHLGVIKRDLERKGVRLIFRKLPTGTDPLSNFMINILGSFAEFEREMIADRTRRGIRHKVEVRKQYLGTTPPYGYTYIKKILNSGKGILKINETEAKVVRQIFEWTAYDKLTSFRIARRLTSMRVPTKTGGSVWHPSVVSGILRNETYIGRWLYSKTMPFKASRPRTTTPYKKDKSSRRLRPRSEWIEVSLPPELQIVDKNLWAAARRQVDSNPRLSPRNVKFKYLLRGLLRCASCSRALRGVYCRDQYKIYVYYCCTGKCGKTPWVPRSLLEVAVWNAIKQLLLDPDKLESRVTSALTKTQEQKFQVQEQQKEWSLGEIEKAELELFKQYQATGVSAEQLRVALDRLQRQKAGILKSKPSDLDTESVHFAVREYCEQIKRELQHADFGMKERILRHVITTVVVGRQFFTIRGAIVISSSQPSTTEDSTAAHLTLKTPNHSDAVAEFEITLPLPPKKPRSRRKR